MHVDVVPGAVETSANKSRVFTLSAGLYYYYYYYYFSIVNCILCKKKTQKKQVM